MSQDNDSIDVRVFDLAYGESYQPAKWPPREAFSVFRSRDYAAIRALATHPRIFPQISDDYTADPAKWDVPRSEQVIYLLASDGDGPFGFGIFVPQTHVQFAAHMAFLPRSYGAIALASFKTMLAWMWANTTALRLVGEIRRDNTLAIRFARRAGFEIYGVNKKSFLRGGQLIDQVCLGISRP